MQSWRPSKGAAKSRIQEIGGSTPLKNDGVRQLGYVGMMTFPTEWKNKKNVPNHQPVSVGHFVCISLHEIC